MEFSDLPIDCSHQAEIIEHAWSQAGGDPAYGLDAAIDLPDHRLESHSDGVTILSGDPGQAAGDPGSIHLQVGQFLAKDVVDLTGQPPLLLLGCGVHA